jgi:hypothetical protein
MDESTNSEDQLADLVDLQRRLDDYLPVLEEHSSLTLTLLEDVAFCGSHVYEDSNKQFWRRTTLRSLISAVEGIIFSTKNLSLKFSELVGVAFTEGEAILLREHNYQIKDNGEVQHTSSKLRTVPNLMFSANMCAKCCGTTRTIVDRRDSRWESVLDTMKLRNRITHPQTSSHLNITDEEFKKMEDATGFFTDVNNAFLKSFTEATLRASEEIKITGRITI